MNHELVIDIWHHFDLLCSETSPNIHWPGAIQEAEVGTIAIHPETNHNRGRD